MRSVCLLYDDPEALYAELSHLGLQKYYYECFSALYMYDYCEGRRLMPVYTFNL